MKVRSLRTEKQRKRPNGAARLSGQRIKALTQLEQKAALLQALKSYQAFSVYVSRAPGTERGRRLGKTLFDLIRDEPSLHELAGEYLEQARSLLDSPKFAERRRAERVVSIFENLGIGEVVFVAPEGPHAIGGGLAQVVCGLMKSLSSAEIPSTLISFIYEEEKSGQHLSADELLREGIRMDDVVVPLRRVGAVEIPFGQPVVGESGEIVAVPERVSAEVYAGEHGLQRLFFLRHPHYAARLYAPADAEKLLRSALFLSRGALELLRSPRFDIESHILITNDWMTGLVPALLRTDPVYVQDPQLSKIETMHVLHNCGRDYQGLIPTHADGKDLWPLLGLAPEHYFGIADPADHSVMNLTAAAVFHVKKAVLTVSKPYAEQLLVDQDSGLGGLIRAKQNIVFGISNGVDTASLQRSFDAIRSNAKKLLQRSGGRSRSRRTSGSSRKGLESEKSDAKALVQDRYNLASDRDAVLVSLVGRLTEQKGIDLLVGRPFSGRASALEMLLTEFPHLQILIAGPPSSGDQSFERLRTLVAQLTPRFGSRLRGVFNFLNHRDVLTIAHASDLFLMPSRYEPGGIAQLEALAAGTPVVARNVGGISVTLSDFDERSGSGNAFLFSEYSSNAFYRAAQRAIKTLGDRAVRVKMFQSAIESEHDWSDRVPKYRALFQYIAGVTSGALSISSLQSSRHLAEQIRAEPRPRRSFGFQSS